VVGIIRDTETVGWKGLCFVPCLQLLLYLVRYIFVVNAHSKLPKWVND
jgi:hypothetical protein